MTIKQQKQRALGAYEQYKRSTATELGDVYGRYSQAKASAFRYCENLMRKLNGQGLKIVSHNVNIFTAGFEFSDPETGVLKFMYVTPTYDIAVEV